MSIKIVHITEAWSGGIATRDEKVIKEYIRNQEAEDKRFDQMNLFNQ